MYIFIFKHIPIHSFQILIRQGWKESVLYKYVYIESGIPQPTYRYHIKWQRRKRRDIRLNVEKKASENLWGTFVVCESDVDSVSFADGKMKINMIQHKSQIEIKTEMNF